MTKRIREKSSKVIVNRLVSPQNAKMGTAKLTEMDNAALVRYLEKVIEENAASSASRRWEKDEDAVMPWAAPPRRLYHARVVAKETRPAERRRRTPEEAEEAEEEGGEGEGGEVALYKMHFVGWKKRYVALRGETKTRRD